MPSFIDDIREPFVVSVREISLVRGRFDGIDWQNRKQDRVSAKRFLVRSNHTAADFADCLCNFSRSWCHRLLEPALGRAQTFRSGFGFARTSPGWSTLDHAETLF